jgi:hypothetical protein
MREMGSRSLASVGVHRVHHTRAETIDAPARRRRSRRFAPDSTRRTRRSSASWRTRACGRQRPTRSLGGRHRRPRPATEASKGRARDLRQRGHDNEVAAWARARAVQAGRRRTRRALPRPRLPGSRRARLPRQPRRPPASAELAASGLDSGTRARRRALLPQLRPASHLRHAAALRRPHAQRGRRAPRARRHGLHRTHLRARHARLVATRRITISEAIRTERAAASRRPWWTLLASSRQFARAALPRSPCASEEPTPGLEPGTPSLRE